MPKIYAVAEYGLIRREADFPDQTNSWTAIYLPADAFESLKGFIAEHEADNVLSYGWQKGRELIRTKNYVGLIETREGVQVEILPKVAGNPQVVLLHMLRHLRDVPFRYLATALSGTARLPLWEVFITAFLDEVSTVIRQGTQQAYVPIETSEAFLRGKLRIRDQIQNQIQHPERLAIAYAERLTNVAPNRLLKSSLLFVQSRARTVANQSRVRQLLFALDDVPVSNRIGDDIRLAQKAGRLFNRYHSIIQWAEILLAQTSFAPKTGSYRMLTLLFPMERVFEDYVAAGFKRYCTEGEITLQESSRHLIDEHGGERRFRLRPDIIWRHGKEVIVLDTKWKTIDAANQAGNYGIDSADMYQLYAYGKKYEASKLVLIYPTSDTFREPLPVFGYDSGLQLRVVPFDVVKPLEQEVRKIMNQEG
ncbi:McrC family protein [Tellurirhabdus bombi]|uniref:McrC family protein n=1 Tax=Tellurirhabdus bombi TaxID=2907205 RepID=UPI001F30EE60|nr:McrC family protein [Tellurirhabdus bombi]